MATIRIDAQPLTQITVIEVEPGQSEDALGSLRERARFMSGQPGFISVSLHRSLDRRRIVNYVQWQSRDLLQAAHESPEFRKKWQRFDALTGSIEPNLYEVEQVFDAATTEVKPAEVQPAPRVT
jgi:heme-degrading monooxygenase HmoA